MSCTQILIKESHIKHASFQRERALTGRFTFITLIRSSPSRLHVDKLKPSTTKNNLSNRNTHHGAQTHSFKILECNTHNSKNISSILSVLAVFLFPFVQLEKIQLVDFMERIKCTHKVISDAVRCTVMLWILQCPVCR